MWRDTGEDVMSLAHIVFMSKKLRKKFGVEGIVASRYLEAGYSVLVGFNTPEGRLSVLAKKEGTVYAIDVIHESRKVVASDVEAVYKKAKSLNAKPILVIYGRGPKLTDEAKAKAKELGVEIKFVK